MEASVFWHKFKTEIVVLIGLLVVAIIGYGGYRFYSENRESAAAAMLAKAKDAKDYQEVIAQYSRTPAGAAAYLMLAHAQRDDRKFEESNKTLQGFIENNPKHELITSARMAYAANLESLGKSDEALSTYQRIAGEYPKDFNAPLAMVSQVPLLKAKKQEDAARRICETVLTQYRESFWANEAQRELRELKSSAPPKPTVTGASGAKSASPALPGGPRPPMAAPSAPLAPAPSPPKAKP